MSGSSFGPSTLSQTEELAQVERIRSDIDSGRFSPQEALYREQVRDNAEVVKLKAAEQGHESEPPDADRPARTLAFAEDRQAARYADLKAEHAAGQTPEPEQGEKDQPAGSRTLAFHEDGLCG